MKLPKPLSVDAAAIALLLGLVAAVIAIPALSHQDPLAIGDVLALRLVPPLSRDAHGVFHLLGTDRFGRDLLVRMMLAGRISLAVGIVGSLLASGLGTIVGALAAWLGGWTDRADDGPETTCQKRPDDPDGE